MCVCVCVIVGLRVCVLGLQLAQLECTSPTKRLNAFFSAAGVVSILSRCTLPVYRQRHWQRQRQGRQTRHRDRNRQRQRQRQRHRHTHTTTNTHTHTVHTTPTHTKTHTNTTMSFLTFSHLDERASCPCKFHTQLLVAPHLEHLTGISSCSCSFRNNRSSKHTNNNTYDP